MEKISGLHHITAIAGGAKQNLDFYSGTLGLRLVKKTVNFDDPGTYHFYYGNESGDPGTILTFFPWEGVGSGTPGVGMATEIGYAVSPEAMAFWRDRLQALKVPTQAETERFGSVFLPFADPDGLLFTLTSPKEGDARMGWESKGIAATDALKGFHSVTLTLRQVDATARVLTDIFGYSLLGQEGNRYRFVTDATATANIVDILVDATGKPGRNAAGTNHHIAFRVPDTETQMVYRERIAEKGFHITNQIDRDYFYSLYFREHGGVLFEIATAVPGFTVDEDLASLGKGLKLPKQYEGSRKEIEAALPKLD